MDLYQRINSFCEVAGVSNFQLCKAIGIQPSILCDLKSGRKKTLQIETAWKIADYFDISIDSLVGRV